MNGKVNGAFDPAPENGFTKPGNLKEKVDVADDVSSQGSNDEPQRAVWGNQIEFLMSCIATSVGLGNVWRFPFVAYQNGGGAFLIPYIIVLFLIGKPMYYLETVIGQFSSKNSVRVWSLSPAMKGTGYAQAIGCFYILAYYVSIIALCLFYLSMSFQTVLPWSVCQPEWVEENNCIPSGFQPNSSEQVANATSSAELYFLKRVLRQLDDIDSGIGLPNWDLTLCLLASWLVIFGVVAQGVKSSGKAAYFLALFPYVVMIILLIRAVTLPSADKGILFFLTPQWEKLLHLDVWHAAVCQCFLSLGVGMGPMIMFASHNQFYHYIYRVCLHVCTPLTNHCAQVWYAAVTQVFFSLSVCTGAIIMFASYNGFRQNVYRDAMIVTTLDTFTSLMAGITIFGILGNLAYQLGYDDIDQVIGSGGTGLAFISYPDAIAKSPAVPQLFSVLFFLMMFVLGVGSSVALLSTINTVMMDTFPRVKTVYMSALGCTVGFGAGIVFVTPGGQYILELVDYYGGTFLVLFAAIAEIVGVFWIYGLENLCLDIEFMLKIKTSFYWRLCWGFITPVMMIVVFIYALVTTEALTFGEDYVYPTVAYVMGYILLFAGILQVPIFIIITMSKRRTGHFIETLKKAFRKKETWGPRDRTTHAEWKAFRGEAKARQELMRTSWIKHAWYSVSGGYRRGL